MQCKMMKTKRMWHVKKDHNEVVNVIGIGVMIVVTTQPQCNRNQRRSSGTCSAVRFY
jgi:hypothetical protein